MKGISFTALQYTLTNLPLYAAPNALSDLRSKIKGLFKSKKSTKPADKPAEPAPTTATEGEAPTATKDATEPAPAATGKTCHPTMYMDVALSDLSL